MINSITFRDVFFAYPRHDVLSRLTVEIPRGTVAAVLGENGTGKSTFAKLINGLLKPQSGTVMVNGQTTDDKQAYELAKEVGYVFQNPEDQIFHSSVVKEVAYGYHQNSGVPVQQALELTGLSELANSNPFDLSLAQRRFIAIASVIVMNTDIIILDEPTAGQDRNGLQRLVAVIRWLKQHRKTVLVITHDMNFVAEQFEQVIALGDGQLQYQGNVTELFRDDVLVKKCGLVYPDIAIIGQQLGIQPLPLTIKQLASHYN